MSWLYCIPTGGLLSPQGEAVGAGYSGAPGYVNDPSATNLPNRGPIPIGFYTIGTLIPHDPKLGAYVLPLLPYPSNVMFGRNDFYLHGDNVAADHSASEGCIVAPHPLRVLVNLSLDRILQVVAFMPPAATG